MSQAIDICLITTSEIDLGVRSLSSFLKARGLNVAVGFFDKWGLYTPGELESIAQWVHACAPRLVGISSIEFSRERTVQLLAALKREGKPVVAGGADPTLNPSLYLNHADFVIRGEGENPLRELLEGMGGGGSYAGIRNLCYKDERGNAVVHELRPLVQNIDDLPFADWLDYRHHYALMKGAVQRKEGFSLTVNEPLRPELRKGLYEMTIRGCAFECDFCINAEMKLLHSGEPYIRKRSIMSTIDRIEQLKRADPLIDIIYFFDDDFFLRTSEEIALFSAEWRKRIDLPFYVNSTPLTLREDKLRALAEAGLLIITMGVQSGSERINREVYRRKGSNEDVRKAAALLNAYVGKGRYGLLPPKYDFIINNPYATEEDLRADVRLLAGLPRPFSAEMHSLKLFQGTRLYQRAVRDGIIVAEKDEATKYNCHDALNNFRVFMKRGGNIYLNSLLYWMNGGHERTTCGIVPAGLVGWLLHPGLANFFNRTPRLLSLLNHILPTHKRMYNWKHKIRKFLSFDNRHPGPARGG